MFSLVQLTLFISLAQALPAAQIFKRVDECAAVPASQTFSSRVCKTACGQDRAGGDLRNKYTGTFASCVAECNTEPKCATAQFREENGYCYLKDTFNALIAVDGTDTVDCCPTAKNNTDTGRVCKTSCG